MKDILMLYKSRDLIMNLVMRDIKVKYKSSVLGILWSLLKPLFLMIILTLVFTKAFSGMKDQMPHYPYALHVLTGVLSWTFVTGALGESVYYIYSHGSLMKKIRINAAAFPISCVISNFVHYCISMIVMFAFLVFYQVQIGPLILLLPVVMLLQFLMVIGLALMLSTLFVFFHDIASIIEVLLMGWFYATPIIYTADMIKNSVPDFWYKMYLLNPQTIVLTFFRNTLLLSDGHFFQGFGPNGEWGPFYLLYILCFIFITLAIGGIVYNRFKDSFVDEL